MSAHRNDVTQPSLVALRPEFCVAADESAIIGIHRAPLHGGLLIELRRAIESAKGAHPAGLASLGVFRLSPRFPLAPGFDGNLHELADTLRALDRMFIANATLIEFGGVRGAAMRLASRAVSRLANPSAAMADFDRLTDAVQWLLPYAQRIGAPADMATWVRLYRYAEEALESV